MNMMELINNGGPVIIILLVLSVVVVTVVVFKTIQFSVMRLWSTGSMDRLVLDYLNGDEEESLKQAKNSSNPVAELLILAHGLKARFGKDDASITEELTCFASEKIEKMRVGLRLIEFVGMISPLLGLLGTVIGMIEAFRQLQMGGSQVDPAILSGGIWVALLTTAVGLGVAIPAVALHNFFEGVVEKTVLRMERGASRIMTSSTVNQKNNIAEGENVTFLPR